MADYDFDVLVIGAGPGGYVAAIRAAQLGLKTGCVESRETLGGTCLNVGCIPSKAMLHASEFYDHAANGMMAKMGIKVTPELDLDTMHGQRKDAVKQLTGGIEFLFKKNKVEWIKGHAAFTAADTVLVGDRSVRAKNIVIATGSSVTPLPGVEIDQKVVVDSTGALELPKVPGQMVVIGGGVIGLELGSVWRRLGAKVTVVEFLDQILPGFDGDVRKEANKIFKKQGIEFKLSTKVTGVTVKGNKATLTVEPAAGGAAETIEADTVLVSIGRKPNTDGLALDKAGLGTNQRGQIEIDHDFKTSVPGIWAIGDVVPGPMLAHKAEDEGHCGRREHRRPARHREPRRDPVGGLYLARNRRCRPDRGSRQGAWRSEGRQVPDAGQQSRQDQSRARRLREGDRGCQDRPRARRVVHRERRRHDDRPSRAGDGVRRDQRGHRLHLPCASDTQRGDQGSSDGGDGEADPHLSRQGFSGS